MELEITNDPAARQFKTVVDGQTAYITYKTEQGVITILSTKVPDEIEGRGIAAALSKYALEFAESHNLQVEPVCRYMQVYLKRRPEYAHLVKS